VVIESAIVTTRAQVASEQGVCVAGHEAEARAGARVLAEGGNAVDALVAAAFTAYVVEPWNCGLGGYGHLAIYLSARDVFVSVDHYVRAPLAAPPDLFDPDPAVPETHYGFPQVVARRNNFGHLAPAVPGAVSGLCAAHERFGRLQLQQVLEPAIEAAERGLPVDWQLVLAIGRRFDEIPAFPAAADFLLPGARMPAIGARLDQSALADTLRRIARDGAAGFHAGIVAEAIHAELAANGGLLTRDDLSAYLPKLTRERPQRYRDLAYVTASDQVTYETLNILRCFDLGSFDPDGVPFRHLVAEALGHGFVDNMTHYGDPDHVRSPVNGLASAAFGRARAAQLRLDRASQRPIRAADPWPYDDEGEAPERLPSEPSVGGVTGTSQVVTADGDGNMTALCTSLSDTFGSVVYVAETGVFLNNGMGNFDPRPGHPNSIAPGKMPIFAAPAMIASRGGRAVFAASGSGGYRIATGVLHTLIGVVDFGLGLQEAIDAPRVHCQGKETSVDPRVPLEVREGLEGLGHDVVVEDERSVPNSVAFGRVSALVAREDGAFCSGASPPFTTAAAAP
jgi:gamma-glutamyltranspeptidase / glutathione hydrolase